MKILEVNKFHYLRRGAERHFLDLVSLLQSRGHEVEVFAMDHPDNVPSRFSRYFPSFVGYYRSEATLWQLLKGVGRIFWSFEAERKMRALLKEWRPDIVHLHNVYHQLSPSILGPIKELGIPIVMTVHDYNLISPDKDIYYPEVGKRYWKFLFVRKYGIGTRILLVLRAYWDHIFRFYENSIDQYIVPSRYVFETLLKAGIPESKMTLLPHFIVDNEPEPLDTATPSQSPSALSLGSLSEDKGTSTLVKLFTELRILLILAGTKEEGFSFEESPYVKYVGQKNREEVTRLIAQSSCVVSASILPETFGLVALEAIAIGKPFFGQKTGAFGEIIENGTDGYLADTAEDLKRALGDFFSGKTKFDPVMIRVRARERFGAQRYAQHIEAIFQHLLGGRTSK